MCGVHVFFSSSLLFKKHVTFTSAQHIKPFPVPYTGTTSEITGVTSLLLMPHFLAEAHPMGRVRVAPVTPTHRDKIYMCVWWCEIIIPGRPAGILNHKDLFHPQQFTKEVLCDSRIGAMQVM